MAGGSSLSSQSIVVVVVMWCVVVDAAADTENGSYFIQYCVLKPAIVSLVLMLLLFVTIRIWIYKMHGSLVNFLSIPVVYGAHCITALCR
jgi:hypothetical protein